MSYHIDSILDILPLDILELIFAKSKEDGDPEAFADLRLVCKAINELIEPQAFSAVQTIAFNKDNAETIEDKLICLASGVGAHSRRTKKLLIRRLVPVEVDEYTQWEALQGEDRERMLKCQAKWLVPAILGLKQVETVETTVSSREPCYDVLCALADLPRLQNLSLFFGTTVLSDKKQSSMPLGLLSNLKNVTLSSIPAYPSVLEGAKKMIAQSPSLEELNLRIYDKESKIIDFSSLLPSENPPSALKKLTVSHDSVSLSASCVPFLLSLTHLHIKEDPGCINPSFWETLQASGVKLQSLDVTLLTRPIINYLLSYSGLQNLTINWIGAIDDGQKICDDLFFSILPKHSETLQVLACTRAALGPWCITKPRLDELYKCQGLKQLDLVYYFPSAEEKPAFPVVPLDVLFSSISQRLPHLQELTLLLNRRFQSNFGCGYAAGQYYNTIYRHFAGTIHKTAFTIPAAKEDWVPGFSVHTVGITFYPRNAAGIPGNYRFMMKDPAEYGIVEDEQTRDCEVDPHESNYGQF